MESVTLKMKQYFHFSNLIIICLIIFSFWFSIAFAENTEIQNLPSLGEGVQSITEYNKNIALEERVMATVGMSFTQILDFFYKGMDKGMGYLKDIAIYLAYVLAIIDCILPILLSGLSVSIGYIIPKIMKCGFILFLIHYWTEIINDGILPFLEHITGTVTQDWELASATLTQPQILLQKAIGLLTPGINYANEQTAFRLVPFPGINGSILYLRLITWFTIALFIILALKIMLSYLQFYFSAMFAIFSFPFGQFKFLKHLPEKFTSGVFNSTLNLFITMFLIHCAFIILKDVSCETLFKNKDNLAIVTNYTYICSCMIGMAKLMEKIPKEVLEVIGGEISFK